MSLRRTILVWITVLFALVGVGASAASYFLAKWETDKLLDAELRQIALNAGEGLSADDAMPRMTHSAEDEIVIQIWNASGGAIFQSSSIALPRQSTLGFADIDFAGKRWRVYAASDGRRTAQVAQRWSARDELARNAALGAAMPVIAAIPIAWIILIWAINRSLGRLSTLAETIAARSVDARDPISLEQVPGEIGPLISAMNSLIRRHQGAAERQRRFVSDAAHELRTPLAALQIQVDNLPSSTRAKNGAWRETIDDLKAGVRRASLVVEQLLKMARMEGPAPSRHCETMDLRELIGGVVADHVAIAGRKDIDLGLSIGDTIELQLSDPDAKLLFANLVDNAIRYTPSGGTVDVALKMDGAKALVEVIDSGCGIPNIALPRIFDRFFRAAPPDIEGTGLGLAIAKAIADRNDFRLTIDNRPDTAGVVARVTIPRDALKNPDLTNPDPSNPRAAAAPGNPPLNPPH
jgi:two-component system OmpR family sensor kinase